MQSALIALATLAFISAGFALGLYLKWRLPEQHLSGDSRDTIKQVIGVLGTVSGICLGLLIASAKNSYDAKMDAVTRISADVINLDRALAHYGAEGSGVRATLRAAVESQRRVHWHDGGLKGETVGAASTGNAIESFQDALRALRPATEMQSAIKSDAIAIGNQLAATRWQAYLHAGSEIPLALLVVLVFWQATMFAGLGMIGARNATNSVAIMVGAVSVTAAIFLILELETPYHGLISISDAPLRLALEQLGR